MGMKARCYQRGKSNYKYYGGRGISVCERWARSYPAFLEDMGRAPSPQHSLDRIDVNGNYEPDNCRWVTTVEQRANRRDVRFIVYEGVAMTAAGWAKKLGLHDKTLRRRLAAGFSFEQAIAIPKSKRVGPEGRLY